ncbi:DNA polymerase III subunit alpha [Oceanobacillus sp. 1P07AA]|uniref:DNA polymerase III subunit alpha n=1 Tax=Oceanobacillus sp. 1P07AA TaxID=3132293 RepID=UPI0039A7619B
MSFTHLYIKSGYSLMESTITIPKLINKAKQENYDSLALTDVGVLYGVISFYQACISNGIKPIVGLTVMVKDEHLDEAVPCILLAKNNDGYQHLISLSTIINLNENKEIEKSLLNSYTNNIVGILPVSSFVKKSSTKEIMTSIPSWSNLFSVGDFYIGVDRHSLDVVQSVQSISIPLTAIQEVRYLHENDDIAYDCLQSIRYGEKWNGTEINQKNKQLHFASEKEMESIFQHIAPEAIANTEKIKEKCNLEIDMNGRHIPSFPVPNGLTADDYLKQLCYSKVEQCYKEPDDQIMNRLHYELEIIQSMNYSDYFLIVADFIQYAKDNQIAVGPGRGSSAGSIVAYVLGITEVDPIEYNLLFERFLNPERLSMPDIDVDFSDVRRDEVIDYVREKYGQDHVAQIITFGTFAARSVLRELMKALDVHEIDMNYVMREIPSQSNRTLTEILQEKEELKVYVKQSPKLKLLFSIAVKLEGIPRNVSTHAAGVVISKNKLTNHVPLTTGTNQTYLTQYAMGELETIGLLKMDFLGLRNLSLIEKVNKAITSSKHRPLHLDEIPEQDETTFQLLRKGHTNGVFQLESDGMKKVLKDLMPSTFEDIVAVNALYRPGPMDFIPVYIRRKKNLEPVSYPHPDLKPILSKTYGVLVYQEQIMQIANKIAGFTLGEADILRRAVSKKKESDIYKQKQVFIDGCINNGYEKEVADEIFSWIVRFANYGFPRSHAVAYSKISYQLAYMKAHYPSAFYAELISGVRNQQEKINTYIQEFKRLNRNILPPDINKSFGKYVVEGNDIRMGLSAINGIGIQPIQEIIQIRKQGAFKNFFDFCMRVNLKIVSRTIIENLVLVGVFDSIYNNRASLLASIDQAIEQRELFKEFLDQPSLFQDQLEMVESYTEIEDFTKIRKLSDEKELLGFYVSSHPLKEYRKQLRQAGKITLSHAMKLVNTRKVVHAVVIVDTVKVIRTKRGERMAFLTISDEEFEVDAVIFPDLFRQISNKVEEGMLLQLSGVVEDRKQRLQIVIQSGSPFQVNDLEEQKPSGEVFIRTHSSRRVQVVEKLRQLAESEPGAIPIIVYDRDLNQSYRLSENYFLRVDSRIQKQLESYFGKENVALK